MKSKKSLKFNKSSIRLLIELLLITVSIFVLTNTSGANYVFNSLMAGAEGEEDNTNGFTISNNICSISSYNGLINFSQSYNANPSGYYNITVVEFSHTQGELQGILTGAAGFVSLGTDIYPFKADIHVADGSSLNFVADTPLFAYVYDSVKITDMNGTTSVPVTIARSSEGNTALFAENVRHLENNDTPSDWTVNIIDYKEGESLITTQYFAGVIGTIEGSIEGTVEGGAKVGLTVNSAVTGGVKVISNGDVGLACCKMGAGSSLNVNVSGVSLYNVESTGGYAGGLVGSATDAEVIFDSAAAASIGGTVSGNKGTGGVFGYYENTQNGEYGLGGYKVNCTLNGNNCGGIFGELKNSDTGTMTINNLVNGQADIDPTTADTIVASVKILLTEAVYTADLLVYIPPTTPAIPLL